MARAPLSVFVAALIGASVGGYVITGDRWLVAQALVAVMIWTALGFQHQR